MCALASWIPPAVVTALVADRSAESAVAWLKLLRDTVEEYDPLVTVYTSNSDSDFDSSCVTPDSAFDEILSQLGKEIFKLDQYQRKFNPADKKVSLSILNIFDKCLDDFNEDDKKREVLKGLVPIENGLVNCADKCSDVEPPISEVSFVTSTPPKCVNVTANNINNIFDKGGGTPVPPRRARLKTPSTSSDYIDMEVKTRDVIDRADSKSDSESTCWSYKECDSECEREINMRNRYAEVWSHSSGFHNSDKILRGVISQHYATESRLSFDTTNDLSPSQYTVYSLEEVGDSHRCVYDNSVDKSPVGNMPPEQPFDDGYEHVRDALATDENIYEEIEYGNSYSDENLSCGGSIEIESVSMSASSEGVGPESPLYANLKDHDAYTVRADVIYWKNLLLDPFYNEDEEDEWITPDEYSVYSREQRPPLVIPRITQFRAPTQRRDPRPTQNCCTDDTPEVLGPTCDRVRAGKEMAVGSSPPIPARLGLDKRLGGSTENLLTPRRPNNLPLPLSATRLAGDIRDVEIRDHVEYARSRKSRSMLAPKPRNSPTPAPRQAPALQTAFEATVIYDGPVKRTKYTENGKKSKKNWTDCYMVLTPTALIFYKDQKTYYATKVPRPPGTPPSPSAPRAELVLPLRNAHVIPCIAAHTRRHTRSVMLTVDYDQYLLQDETEEGARKWLLVIQNIIYKLGPPAIPDEFNNSIFNPMTAHYQSSNTDLESLGRTPPVSRHNKNKQKAGCSSNEDLSDSTDKSLVTSKLRKLLRNRSSKDVLYKKGILRDEPVFGRNLEDVCPSSSPRVPAFVVECIKEIESSEENMCTDGLYRASGNLSQVQKIRLEVDQNNLRVIKENTDIHVLTGSLKLFFRELKEPLIPCTMFQRVLAACSIKPKEAKIKEFRKIIEELHPCNRDTLKFLLEHLLKVTKYSEQNRMHTANLAIVFGPTLLWAPMEQADRMATDCIQQNNVVEILLNNFKDIFVEAKKA